MASADVQGNFLWHELVTTDPAAAGAFYGKVLGWTPQAWDKDPHYTVLLTPKGPVGGMMKPGADSQGTGSSAQWIAYVGSANIEETTASAKRLGGRVLKGATDIPGGGRYALLADPQGAVFGIHTPPATGASGHAGDAFTWHELATSDHADALRFYRELFGWEQLAVHDMGGSVGPYVIFGRGGQQLGGIFTRTGGSGPHWLPYVRVSSASRAADSAKAAGGRVINGPHQVPGGSWIAQLADPHGAAIAVNQPQAAGESAQPPKSPAKPTAPPAAPARPATSAPSGAAGSAATTARPGVSSPSTAAPERRPAPAAAPAASASHAAVVPPAARPAATAAHSAPKAAAPEKPAVSATPAASGRGASASTRGTAARKTTPRKSAARSTARAGTGRKKKAARPARGRAKTASAAKKRSAKKGSAARSRRGAAARSSRPSAGARSAGRRAGAGARKTARGGKRAPRRSGRR